MNLERGLSCWRAQGYRCKRSRLEIFEVQGVQVLPASQSVRPQTEAAGRSTARPVSVPTADTAGSCSSSQGPLQVDPVLLQRRME